LLKLVFRIENSNVDPAGQSEIKASAKRNRSEAPASPASSKTYICEPAQHFQPEAQSRRAQKQRA
jgi:hypothetical protein